MRANVTVSFSPTIEPQVIAGAKFVCAACCDLVQLHHCDNGCCIVTTCPAGHPQIMIKDGKVMGTSA